MKISVVGHPVEGLPYVLVAGHKIEKKIQSYKYDATSEDDHDDMIGRKTMRALLDRANYKNIENYRKYLDIEPMPEFPAMVEVKQEKTLQEVNMDLQKRLEQLETLYLAQQVALESKTKK